MNLFYVFLQLLFSSQFRATLKLQAGILRFLLDDKIENNEMAEHVARMVEMCIWGFGGKS